MKRLISEDQSAKHEKRRMSQIVKRDKFHGVMNLISLRKTALLPKLSKLNTITQETPDAITQEHENKGDESAATNQRSIKTGKVGQQLKVNANSDGEEDDIELVDEELKRIFDTNESENKIELKEIEEELMSEQLIKPRNKDREEEMIEMIDVKQLDSSIDSINKSTIMPNNYPNNEASITSIQQTMLGPSPSDKIINQTESAGVGLIGSRSLS